MERIDIVHGDITKAEVDAIVNAANSSLRGGGGVDGAIHRAAGPELLEESKSIGGCPTGEARVTSGYNLPARIVIHTVGPVWQGGSAGEPEDLANCYRNSLRAALEHNAGTVAFPAISTGVYGYPLDKATWIALTETKEFLAEHEAIKHVYFYCFDERTFEVYQKIAAELFL